LSTTAKSEKTDEKKRKKEQTAETVKMTYAFCKNLLKSTQKI